MVSSSGKPKSKTKTKQKPAQEKGVRSRNTLSRNASSRGQTLCRSVSRLATTSKRSFLNKSTMQTEHSTASGKKRISQRKKMPNYSKLVEIVQRHMKVCPLLCYEVANCGA